MTIRMEKSGDGTAYFGNLPIGNGEFLVTVDSERPNNIVVDFEPTGGDQFTVIDHDPRGVYGQPFYETVFGFLEYAGEYASIGVIQYESMGTVICIYDNGPYVEEETFPDGTDCKDEGYTRGGNMGYALNLDDPVLSEWEVIASFPYHGQTVEQFNQNNAAFWDSVQEQGVTVIEVPGSQVVGQVF